MDSMHAGRTAKRFPHRLLVLGATIMGLTIGACGRPTTLEVVIGDGIKGAAPDQIDSLRVAIAASRTPEGDFCKSLARSFDLRPDAPMNRASLPVRVAVEQGGVYDQWVAFQVVGYRDGAPVLSYSSRHAWPDSGTGQLSVPLWTSCIAGSAPECAAGEQCEDGACVAVSAVPAWLPDGGLAPDTVAPNAPFCDGQ